jgi:hypothetical protein
MRSAAPGNLATLAARIADHTSSLRAVLTGCYPEINNLSLVSTSARTILPIIHQLLEQK